MSLELQGDTEGSCEQCTKELHYVYKVLQHVLLYMHTIHYSVNGTIIHIYYTYTYVLVIPRREVYMDDIRLRAEGESAYH